uniref:E3 ubiquitin-protein ligase RNF149 n=1 Tax=Pogona vitticeps TaxID=103695 RepID=A0A6J0UMJ3_9SAUR
MVSVRRAPLPLLLVWAAWGAPRVSWSLVWYTAWVSTVYTEPGTNRTVWGSAESGRYGESSPKVNAQGLVGIPRSGSSAATTARPMEGCAPDVEYEVPMPLGASRRPSGEPSGDAALPLASWIALVAHGGCSLKDKVANAARKRATAVVIYNEPRFGNSTFTVPHLGTGNTVVIMVGYPKGMEILEPVRRGIPVKMTIGVGKQHVQEYITGQSVVFVAIAFITMMIISLAWLIFFYIQRFLYSGSQFRRQGHREETIKAIGQLSLHIVKHEDKGLDIDAENCAICIENYKPKDAVRILPCKHVFHRHCIDPWLLEHRTCPMCKLDVIKALGYWGETKEVPDVVVSESVSGSISAESWTIAIQEENRNETSDLSGSSANESALNSNSLKEDAGETTALLEKEDRNILHEEYLPGGNT